MAPRMTQPCLPQVQTSLGIKGCIAFDLTAACSGFVLATITASQFVRAGTAKNILVIGADALSRYVDWRDRGAGMPRSFPSRGARGSITCGFKGRWG